MRQREAVADERRGIPLRDLRPGDTVEIVPGHGCTTVNLYDRYYVMRDEVVEAVWPVAGRGRSQ